MTEMQCECLELIRILENEYSISQWTKLRTLCIYVT